jgi:hypothetical protein
MPRVVREGIFRRNSCSREPCLQESVCFVYVGLIYVEKYPDEHMTVSTYPIYIPILPKYMVQGL